MNQLLVKNAPFIFSEECIQAFDKLKQELTQSPIMVKHDWSLPFELMCDASDYAIRAVLGQRRDKHLQPIHYASKTINEAVDAKPQLIKWILLLQEFDIEIRDKREAKNLAVDHLSRLENSNLETNRRINLRLISRRATNSDF
ncbi:reverse transcriptase domain-containing protein [Tanacetum coccineum]